MSVVSKGSISTVPDGTVVKLADGRVGWKGMNTASTRYNRILFADGSGVELPPEEEVEVLMYPAMLAKEYVTTYERIKPWVDKFFSEP